MVCLVTGARGLLGRHVLATLRQDSGGDIRSIVRGEPENETEIRCDLSDPAAVARVLDATQPDRIFHLAGSFSNVFEEDLRNNVLAAGNLLGWVADRSPATRVVVTGSAAEYGVVTADSNPVREDHPTRPHTVYGVTKLLQTDVSLFHHRRFGVNVMVARVFNLLGPGASPRLLVGSVEQQIHRVLDGSSECVTVGNLDGVRDYLAPAHAAAALLTLMRLGQPGEIYNVGSGVPVRVRDVLDAMLAEAGLSGCPVRVEAAPAHRSHDVPVIYADVDKLRRLGAVGLSKDHGP
jgi:GDP-4-dehydro-6-deoxy-D-mannose reductase